MSHADHEWAKEQIAAHLAGGLAAEERARLEAHAGSCAECIAELDAARRFDRQMDDLFAPVRARAGMEERIIQRLRLVTPEKQRPLGRRIALVAASFVLTGVLGYVFVEVDAGRAPFEGLATERASNAPAVAMRLKAAEPTGVYAGSEPEPLARHRAGDGRAVDQLQSADDLAH